MTHLALHCCCAPCTIEPLRDLATRYDRVTLVYYNPNIHPADEYARRRDQFAEYAADLAAEFVEIPYDASEWVEAITLAAADSPKDEPFDRCAACYRLRLSRVARWAAEHGADSFSTTLTVSPYQSQEGIRAAGERVAAETGVAFDYHDYSDRYPAATEESRALGMYRQNYCGCFLSKIEAEAERAARREARRSANR